MEAARERNEEHDSQRSGLNKYINSMAFTEIKKLRRSIFSYQGGEVPGNIRVGQDKFDS